MDEVLVPRLVKGTAVYCEGYLNLARWEGPDGSLKSTLNMVAWNVTVMGQMVRRMPSAARKQAALEAVARNVQDADHQDGPALADDDLDAPF
jgi:single-stranded DNA-binding protein